MQFDDSGHPVRFSLFAVLERADDEQEAREWLSEIARAIPADLGVADQIEAATADGYLLPPDRDLVRRRRHAADVASREP